MANWVPLKEVLKSPDKYGDISKIPIDYTPDYSKITLIEEQTGVSNPQDFETEMDHTWYATLHKDMVYLVSGEVTKQDLSLCGKTGYENGGQVQRKIANLFENAILGTTGEIWTEETIEIAIKTLPEFLRKIKGIYWTAIKYKYCYSSTDLYYFGLQVIDSGTLYGNYHSNYGDLYICSVSTYSYSYGARLLVHLPSNILINTEEISMRASLNLWTPDMVRRQGEIEKQIIPVTSYSITQEELKELEQLAKWHREKAAEISALVKKIKQS